MMILTSEKQEKMEYYAKIFRDAMNDATEDDGDLFNKISVCQIYNEVKGLVRIVLGDEEAEKMEKHLVSARIRGVERRMNKLEARHKILAEELKKSE